MLQNVKLIIIIILFGTAIWFYKDYKHQKSENQRQTENISQLRQMDSMRYASQYYSKKELQEYLDYNRTDLKEFLNENNVKIKRIEKIITQSLEYRDTASQTTNLQPILDAIKEQRAMKVPIIDSTACMIIKGWVVFDKDTLSLDITDRKFTNRSDVVTYWERNQWKFLGIKTRLFGRKKATVIIKDECGRTETFTIDTKK